jgi:hypothetical protein
MQCTCAMLSPVACPALQYFFPYYLKISQFSKKNTEDQNFVLIFFLQISSETFLTIRKNERDMMKNGLYVKYPLSLSDSNENLILSTDFLKKNTQIISFV